jgi:prepilin-type N-terminal cleavage/methylation domain-containing protein
MLSKISARLRKREGFTLIELLVVVAIIGLLATLAMPRVFESINKAKRAQGDADVHTMSTAIEQLFMESANSTYPTMAVVADNPATPTVDESSAPIKDLIVGTGLLKAHAKELINPFNRGYIYVTDGGAWYAVIDPASSPVDTASVNSEVTLTCGTGNTATIAVKATFTVLPNASGITLDDIKQNGCTATNSSNTKLSVITN